MPLVEQKLHVPGKDLRDSPQCMETMTSCPHPAMHGDNTKNPTTNNAHQAE